MTTSQTAQHRVPRFASFVCWCFLVSLLLFAVRFRNHVDPDLWHEISHAREIVSTGSVPDEDHFAFTTTVRPVVHHEWGAGLIVLSAVSLWGGTGLMAVKYALCAAILAATVLCAIHRGASLPVVALLAVVTHIGMGIGMVTIRAQMFSMLLLAVLLYLLDRDREGDRRWMIWWLPLYVLWLNLHAGFAFGAAVFVVYAIEQAIRRQPVWHLAAVAAAMAILVVLNPHGTGYYGYLARALPMDRSLIIEWGPLLSRPESGQAPPVILATAITVYAVLKRGWRECPGILVVIFVTYTAFRHLRHVHLFVIVWLCWVPAWVGTSINSFWQKRPWPASALLVILSLLMLNSTFRAAPWSASVPTGTDNARFDVAYPVGAVEYLEQTGFEGNLVTPFEVGAFVSWKLYPRVKVSVDSRYEVAYPPELVARHFDFYDALPGWEQLLSDYPADLVLVPRDLPIAAAVPDLAGWERVYRDSVYEIWGRHGLGLKTLDRDGEPLVGTFPKRQAHRLCDSYGSGGGACA